MKYPKFFSNLLIIFTLFTMAFSIGPSQAGDIVEGPVTIDSTGVHIEVSNYPDPANQLTFEDSSNNSFARIGAQDVGLNDFYIIADPFAGADTFMHLSSLSSSGYTARTMLFSGESGAVQNVGISMLSGPGTNDRIDLNSFQTDADTYLWGTSTVDPVARVDAGDNSLNVTTLNVYGPATFNGIIVTPKESNTVISSDTITVTGPWHKADTQGAAAADNICTILGGVAPGQSVYLSTLNSNRDVTILDGGPCNTALSGNLLLDHVKDRVELQWDGAEWVQISFSNNQ
jgi:hypothetical protein